MKATPYVLWLLAALTLPAAHCLAVSSAAAQLREAWIQHRLKRDMKAAEKLYVTLVEQNDAHPDLRARAALGLGILKRDLGEMDLAASWFRRAIAESGADLRWRQNARMLLLRVEPQEDLAGTREDFEQTVKWIDRELMRVRQRLREGEEELRRKNALIRRLEERLSTHQQTMARNEEVKRNRALDLLEKLEEHEKQALLAERSLVLHGLTKARSYYSQGRLLNALNEVKKVLHLEPKNREALELRSRCSSLLAVATGQRVLPRPDPQIGQSANPTHRMLVDWMKADLERGQSYYRQGKVAPAIAALRKVLEEYAWCPTVLSEDEIDMVIAPAEHLLQQCFESQGVGEEAMILQGIDPKQGVENARQEVQRLTGVGQQAARRGEIREASIAYQDVLTWLGFFPDLDPDQKLAKDIRRRLEALQVPVPQSPGSERGRSGSA
ncbi:MAG: tetratricopeptide repeat protein [Planctomycetota bacterium]